MVIYKIVKYNINLKVIAKNLLPLKLLLKRKQRYHKNRKEKKSV